MTSQHSEADTAGGTDKPMKVFIQRLSGADPIEIDATTRTTVADLMEMVAEQLLIPSMQQANLILDEAHLENGSKTLEESGITNGTMLTLMVGDNKKLITWDVDGNPHRQHLDTPESNGNILTCCRLHRDFVSVVTKASLVEGRHYFQFIMHYAGDEAWCGITPLPEQVETNPHPHSLRGWLYYCGRRSDDCPPSSGGLMFMSFPDHHHKDSAAGTKNGDVIGMAIDLDECKIVFDLNGKCQGYDKIPKLPMRIITTVDTIMDKFEVRKLALSEVPLESLEALQQMSSEVGDVPEELKKNDADEYSPKLACPEGATLAAHRRIFPASLMESAVGETQIEEASVLTSKEFWASENGQCHIFRNHITNRLLYDELIGDGSDKIYGWLDAKGKDPDGCASWEADLMMADADEDPWYGPAFGEKPDVVGKISLRLLNGAAPQVETKIIEGEGSDWGTPVLFTPIADDNDDDAQDGIKP